MRYFPYFRSNLKYLNASLLQISTSQYPILKYQEKKLLQAKKYYALERKKRSIHKILYKKVVEVEEK